MKTVDCCNGKRYYLMKNIYLQIFTFGLKKLDINNLYDAFNGDFPPEVKIMTYNDTTAKV